MEVPGKAYKLMSAGTAVKKWVSDRRGQIAEAVNDKVMTAVYEPCTSLGP